MSVRKMCKVVAVLFCLGTVGIAQTPRHVAVHAGHVLDVKTGKLLADQTLVIEDGKIISSGAAAEAKIPAGCGSHRPAERNRAARPD